MALAFKPVQWIRSATTLRKYVERLALISGVAFLALNMAERVFSMRLSHPIFNTIEMLLGGISLALIAIAALVRLLLIRAPAEALLAHDADARLKSYRDLVLGWIDPRPGAGAAQHWRYIETAEDFATLVELNVEGFRSSHYAVDRDLVEKRNRAILDKHPRCFALIYDPLSNNAIIGYTCIIPIVADARELYLQGDITDANFRAMHVAAPGNPAAALIVFAIVLDKRYQQSGQRRADSPLASFVAAGVAHARELARDLADRNEVYAQCEKGSISTLLEALYFEKTEFTSAEGFPFYRLRADKLRKAQAERLKSAAAAST